MSAPPSRPSPFKRLSSGMSPIPNKRPSQFPTEFQTEIVVGSEEFAALTAETQENFEHPVEIQEKPLGDFSSPSQLTFPAELSSSSQCPSASELLFQSPRPSPATASPRKRRTPNHITTESKLSGNVWHGTQNYSPAQPPASTIASEKAIIKDLQERMNRLENENKTVNERLKTEQERREETDIVISNSVAVLRTNIEFIVDFISKQKSRICDDEVIDVTNWHRISTNSLISLGKDCNAFRGCEGSNLEKLLRCEKKFKMLTDLLRDSEPPTYLQNNLAQSSSVSGPSTLSSHAKNKYRFENIAFPPTSVQQQQQQPNSTSIQQPSTTDLQNVCFSRKPNSISMPNEAEAAASSRVNSACLSEPSAPKNQPASFRTFDFISDSVLPEPSSNIQNNEAIFNVIYILSDKEIPSPFPQSKGVDQISNQNGSNLTSVAVNNAMSTSSEAMSQVFSNSLPALELTSNFTHFGTVPSSVSLNPSWQLQSGNSTPVESSSTTVDPQRFVFGVVRVDPPTDNPASTIEVIDGPKCKCGISLKDNSGFLSFLNDSGTGSFKCPRCGIGFNFTIPPDVPIVRAEQEQQITIDNKVD